jgi:hypothetical protein
MDASKPIPFVDDWISYREAAALMHQSPAQLRRRDAAGNWALFPELARIQFKKGGAIFLFRSQVMAWRERMERIAKENAEAATTPKTRILNSVNSYADIAPEIARMGGNRLAKKLASL